MSQESKRVLVISHLPILPATAGNRIRVWALMNNLRALGHDVWFMGLGLKPKEEEAIRKAWGDQVIVEPYVSVRHAKPRLKAFMRWALDRAVGEGWVKPDLDYRVWPHWEAAVRKLAREQKFDIVIVEYVFYSKVLLAFEGAVKVIDTHDLYTDRAKKMAARNIKSHYWSLTREQEARGLGRADVIIAIQRHEAAFFDELTEHKKRVLVVGHTVALRPLPAPDPAERTLLFVGTSYLANVDGARHFIERVLPLVKKKFPDVRLLVAGTVCGELKADVPGVELLGVVDRLEDAYARAAIVVNPVLAGTGLKTKTVEALGHAKPLVTTACGAEGIEEAAGSAFLMADDPAEMAVHINGLLESPSRAADLAQRGFHFAGAWNEAQIASLRSLDQPVRKDHRDERDSPRGSAEPVPTR
jgi:glycosyltransferase involved in cell wall biosynthesis